MTRTTLALVSGGEGRLMLDNFNADDVRELMLACADREQKHDTLGDHDAAAHARRLMRRLRVVLELPRPTNGT